MDTCHPARSLALWTLALALSIDSAAGHGLEFALVGKSVDDFNFIRAGEGCAQEAKAHGDTCRLLGGKGSEHFRRQDQAVAQALTMNLDGLAISVTNSRWLAENSLKGLKDKGIPLLTFDSDLAQEHRHLRRAYVGVDNLAFGRQLGRLAQRFLPQGGHLCLMSGGRLNPNLNERIRGIRQQLSGAQAFPPEAKLAGENGWREAPRCPLYNFDDPQTPLDQMSVALAAMEIDVLVSVGAWPVISPDNYRQNVRHLQQRGADPTIIIGIGEPLAAQLDLLEDQSVDAYLSINFSEMGRMSYRRMKQLASGQAPPKETFIDSAVYLRKAQQRPAQ